MHHVVSHITVVVMRLKGLPDSTATLIKVTHKKCSYTKRSDLQVERFAALGNSSAPTGRASTARLTF